MYFMVQNLCFEITLVFYSNYVISRTPGTLAAKKHPLAPPPAPILHEKS